VPQDATSSAQPTGTAAPAGRRPGVTLLVLAAAGMVYALLQGLVVPVLPLFAAVFKASAPDATWILTAYLLAAAMMTAVGGRLGDMFGRRRMLAAVLAVAAAGAALSGSAPGTALGVMIAGRVLQGAAAAAFPLAFAIIREQLPARRAPSGNAVVSAVYGIGGGLGIILAGPVTQHLSWRWLFWIPLMLAVACLAAVLTLLPESRMRSGKNISWIASWTAGLLLSAGLAALLTAISQGPSWGWGSARVAALFAAAAVLCAAWVIAEVRAAEPLVDMKMMRLRGVWTTNAASVLLGFGVFGMFVLIPTMAELPRTGGFGFAASITGAGLYLLPAVAAMPVFAVVAGVIHRLAGSKPPMAAGALISMAGFAFLAADHASSWQVYLGSGIIGAGIGLSLAAMANLIVTAVPSHQTGVATGMNILARTVGGSLGAQIAATVLASNPGPHGLPGEHGFTVSFAIGAIGLAASFLASLAIPGNPGKAAQHSGAAAGHTPADRAAARGQAR
jgi:MFS family permease